MKILYLHIFTDIYFYRKTLWNRPKGSGSIIKANEFPVYKILSHNSQNEMQLIKYNYTSNVFLDKKTWKLLKKSPKMATCLTLFNNKMIETRLRFL